MSRKKLALLLGLGILFTVLGIAIYAFLQMLQEEILPSIQRIIPSFNLIFTKAALIGISLGFIIIGILLIMISVAGAHYARKI